MASAEVALGFAAPLAASWSRSSFFSVIVSVQTTERYLGCTQRISSAVNHRIGIGPDFEASTPEP
jgi:hypothetical protein